MAFLDKMSDLGKSVAKKSGEAVDAAKIKLKISEHKSRIREYKIQMGSDVCQAYEAGELLDDNGLYQLYLKVRDEEEAIKGLEASL